MIKIINVYMIILIDLFTICIIFRMRFKLNQDFSKLLLKRNLKVYIQSIKKLL